MNSVGMYSAGIGFCVGATLGVVFLTQKKYKKAVVAAGVAVLSLVFALINAGTI